MLRKFKKPNKREGFSLLELMVAIFVLIVGMLGVSEVVFTAISAHRLNRDRLVASYLAQEGIELVRNIRDTNWIQKKNFASDLPSGSWEIDVRTQTLTSYSGRYLKVDPSGVFQYSSGKETPFKRRIEITRHNNDYLEVRAIVEWSRASKNYKVEAVTYLYNWCPKIRLCS